MLRTSPIYFDLLNSLPTKTEQVIFNEITIGLLLSSQVADYFVGYINIKLITKHEHIVTINI